MRDFSNIEEHYTITTTNGTMTKEQFEAQRLKKREEPERKMEKYVSCPIRKSTCRRDCAFRIGFDCAFRLKETETKGKNCPFTGNDCGESCGFYHNGCIMGGFNE